MKQKLKHEIVERIKSDFDLYAVVGKAAGCTPLSLPGLLYKGSFKLVTIDVLNAISLHTGIKVEDLTD